MNWQLHQGNCVPTLWGLPPGSVQLVYFSPPNPSDIRKHFNGPASRQYVVWMMEILDACRHALSPTGNVVFTFKENVVDGERSSVGIELLYAAKQNGWHWRDEYVWLFSNPPLYRGKNRLKDGFYRIHNLTPGLNSAFYPEAVKQPGREGGGVLVGATNVVRSAYGVPGSGHPAAQPLIVPSFFIHLMTLPGELVCDCMCGSGNTGVAALRAGRRFVGMELDEQWVPGARARLASVEKELQ